MSIKAGKRWTVEDSLLFEKNKHLSDEQLSLLLQRSVKAITIRRNGITDQKSNNSSKLNKCTALIQSGKNMGKQCNKTVSEDSIKGTYCTLHLNYERKTSIFTFAEIDKLTVDTLKSILESKDDSNYSKLRKNELQKRIIDIQTNPGLLLIENTYKQEVKTSNQNIKYKKQPIAKAVRELVFKTYEKECNGKCWCCDSEPITHANFQCGHIKAERDGGLPTIENFRPICASCNTSMGTQDMIIFKQKHGMMAHLTQVMTPTIPVDVKAIEPSSIMTMISSILPVMGNTSIITNEKKRISELENEVTVLNNLLNNTTIEKTALQKTIDELNLKIKDQDQKLLEATIRSKTLLEMVMTKTTM